jgi:hypothetical protein
MSNDGALLGIGLFVVGTAIMLAGYAWLLAHLTRQHDRQVGLRTFFLGAIACVVAMAIYIGTLPSSSLPFPGNLLGALLFAAIAVRTARSAIRQHV